MSMYAIRLRLRRNARLSADRTASRSNRRRASALLIAAATALTLAGGCTSADDKAVSAPKPSGPARMSPVPTDVLYNPADVIFAQDVLANVSQAIEIIKLAQQKSTNPEIKQLAAKGEENRGAGIYLVPTWLEKYKQPIPPSTAPESKGFSKLPISPEELTALSAARGTEFDQLFLRAMIKIDEAMKTLVNGQQWNGINGPLLSLSHKLSDDLTTELSQLRGLLAG